MTTWMYSQPVGQQWTTTRETKTATDVRTRAQQQNEDNKYLAGVVVRQKDKRIYRAFARTHSPTRYINEEKQYCTIFAPGDHM